MIVMDAAAAVEFLLHGAEAHPRRHWFQRQDFHAPYLADIETMHALRRHSLHRTMAAERLDEMVAILASWKITFHAHRPYLGRVWGLRHRCTAYDALYVALAEALDCPLLTADRRLAHAVEGLIPVEIV